LLNSSIIELDVQINPITVKATHLLLKSAVDNGVHEVVYISKEDELEEDSEIQKMKNILETRQRVYRH